MAVETPPTLDKARTPRPPGKGSETRPQMQRKAIPQPPSEDLPVMVYFDFSKSDPGASQAIEEVEGALTDFLRTYGLEMGEREEISGSFIIKFKAFGGLSVEFEIRLDLLAWLSKGAAGKKEIPPERKSALERLEAAVAKHGQLAGLVISVGSIILAAVSLIHGWNPPPPTQAPVPQPQYIYVLQEKDVMFVEVDRAFANDVHSGRVTMPQLKTVIAEEVKKA
jgi:hypothetical protein